MRRVSPEADIKAVRACENHICGSRMILRVQDCRSVVCRVGGRIVGFITGNIAGNV